MKNIVTNSKALIKIIYNNIKINDFEVDNITCNGDSGDSSFIVFISNDSNKNSFQVNNFNIKNSYTNGQLIKINGGSNEIIMENLSISNIISYGSVIEISSKKVRKNNHFYN